MKTMKRVLFTSILCAMLCASVALVLPEVASAYPESPLPYRIHVSRTRQVVTVFSTDTNEVVRQMICSTGLGGSPTITGTFKMPKPGSDERKNWYAFSSSGATWAHYATRIKGSYLFHSVLYRSASTSSLNRQTWSILGSRASHGCVRMTPLDAQWIAYNCAAGTVVTINDRIPKGTVAKGGNLITNSSQIKRTLPNPSSNGTLPGYEPTLKPTPKPDQAANKPTLDVGIVGPLTKSMQGTLQSLGYYTGTVSGTFTEGTKLALESFQTAYLKQNPGTSEDSSVTGLGTPLWQARVKAAKSELQLTGTRRTLKLGRKGLSVKVLRTRLNELNYITAKSSTTYDAGTRDAVKLFQRANGLKADGVATQSVQDAILDANLKPLPYARVSLKSGLSLRKSASARGTVVAKLKYDVRLRVVKPDAEWSLVAVGAKSGYVLSQHLTYEDPSLNPNP